MVVRKPRTPDIAYVGGIDLCHTRRDDSDHAGDPQGDRMAPEYGDTPPWHDVQAAIQGPAVHDVETVFRERWEDPTPLSRFPMYRWQDGLHRLDVHPDPLPEQAPPPPPAGTHTVQLLRTYAAQPGDAAVGPRPLRHHALPRRAPAAAAPGRVVLSVSAAAPTRRPPHPR